MNLTNHYLIALPNKSNDMFSSSVVYITEHRNISGAIGVIINKPLGRTLKNAFKDVDFAQYNPSWSNNSLYLGGPVSNDNGFVLQPAITTDGKMFELTNNRNVLDKIANSNFKNNLFVAIGYASWMSEQLENEVINNSWLVLKAGQELIFDIAPHKRYNEALSLLGVKNLSHLYNSGKIIA
ncbi:MAG: YqgE/AlgH family protein [Burkholderiales bacterium]|nr:YqgE/AlgH family protein [Burkholderiales bacterium]